MAITNPFFQEPRGCVFWSAIPPSSSIIYHFRFFNIQKTRCSNLDKKNYYVYKIRVLEDYSGINPLLYKHEIVDLHISIKSFVQAVQECKNRINFANANKSGVNDVIIKMSRDSQKKITIHEMELSEHDPSAD